MGSLSYWLLVGCFILWGYIYTIKVTVNVIYYCVIFSDDSWIFEFLQPFIIPWGRLYPLMILCVLYPLKKQNWTFSNDQMIVKTTSKCFDCSWYFHTVVVNIHVKVCSQPFYLIAAWYSYCSWEYSVAEIVPTGWIFTILVSAL